MKELEPGDRVKILSGGPHEHFGRTATLSYTSPTNPTDWVLYFGDNDEDEWVYSPYEFEVIT